MTQENMTPADVLQSGGSAATSGTTRRQRWQDETITAATRPERDSMGVVDVPAAHYWGAQTQRSLKNFAISSERLPGELISALALVKSACAKVNLDLGRLPANKATAIIEVAEEIAFGRHADDFPLSVWQTGSGTQSNMNINEVLANCATARIGEQQGSDQSVRIHIDPNDDVNAGQSSNDVFPTAMHVAAVLGIAYRVIPALTRLTAAFSEKSADFADIIKIGRTHLQDATPLSLGQEFSGYVAQLAHAKTLVGASLASLYPLAIGGTAVGTGLNTHAEFGSRVAAELAARTGLPFTSADNKFAALTAHDGLVAAHGALKTLAVALVKIANDIRWLASGPRCGIGELHLPENEPGSSIMPGKVNPTQCEAMIMLCYQVMANDVAIGLGGASGSFELNVCKPLIAHNMLQSIRLLADGMRSLERNCVQGITANRERIDQLLGNSLMLVTALAPHIGYDKAATVAKYANEHGSSLKEAALSLGYVSAEDYDHWVVAADMIRPAS